MIKTALLIIIVALFTFFIKKAWSINQTWKNRGIKHMKPVLFFGNMLPICLNRKGFHEVISNLRKAFPNESVLGFYEFMKPQLLIFDPDLIQKVLITDFAHFSDHLQVDFLSNPRDDQLFVMSGSRWRAFRVKMSPIFTSGKLRDMIGNMTSCGENLLDYIEQRKFEDIDIREVMGLFSMDVIGSAVFGMDPQTLKNPNCEFRRIGKELNQLSLKNIIRMMLLLVFPTLSLKLGISFLTPEVEKYYSRLIQQQFDYRKEKGLYRNDFTQMLMELKNKGKIEVHSWDSNDDYLKTNESIGNLEKFEITDDIIMGQAQAFLVAGFEPTAANIAFTIYELTQHPEFQERAREEVLIQTNLHGGFTFEALKNMKFVEAAVKETQRLHPMLPWLLRVCTKEYTLPNGYVIQKGDAVFIPIGAVHMDPENFAEPNTYNPDRFLESIKPMTFLPFGEGPRVCIAMRFSLMVMKYGVAKLLAKYKWKLSEKTKLPLEIRMVLPIPKDKILVKADSL